jgi:hypothetical protein
MTTVRLRTTPSWVDRHVGLALAGLVALVAATVVIGGQIWPAAAEAAGGSTPYSDTQATGFLTLYDKAGKAIKSGHITDKPFVWKAVSSKKAEAPYDKTGRKATLAAFQPRPGTQPSAWSSDTLTASTTYTDPAHPTAQATAGDFSLKDFLGEFPPKWDGTIQLRLILSAPGTQAQATGYASTDIKINGNWWYVMGGGPGAGKGGVNIPGKVDSAATASAAPSGSAAPGASAAAPGASASPADASGSGAGDDIGALTELPYMRTPGYLFVASAAVVALVFAGLLLRRRQRFASGGW